MRRLRTKRDLKLIPANRTMNQCRFVQSNIFNETYLLSLEEIGIHMFVGISLHYTIYSVDFIDS